MSSGDIAGFRVALVMSLTARKRHQEIYLQATTGDAFRPNVVSVQAIGDELVIVHRKQVINMDGRQLESDVVVVWRIVGGQIAEVWDIPSLHTARALSGSV